MATDHLEKPSLAASLSFGGGSASADDHGTTSVIHHHEAAEADDDSSEDFEFAFVVRDPDAFPSATADEIFSDGRILPSYPVFNRDFLLLPHSDDAREVAADASDMAHQIPLRKLLLDEKEAPSASSPEVPEAAGEYCAWAPDRCKKSASTGSSLRWRLRDLMVGRSHSDGKEKFVFLQEAAPAKERRANATETKAAATKPGKAAKKGVRVTEMDVVAAHRLYYGKGASEKAGKGTRRTYLPYRQELFGLFAPANTLHRAHHPF